MLILFCITNFSYFIDQIRRPDSISLPTRLNQKNEFDEEVFFCSNIVSCVFSHLTFFFLASVVRPEWRWRKQRERPGRGQVRGGPLLCFKKLPESPQLVRRDLDQVERDGVHSRRSRGFGQMLSSDEPTGRVLAVGHQVGKTIFPMFSLNSPFAKLFSKVF